MEFVESHSSSRASEPDPQVGNLLCSAGQLHLHTNWLYFDLSGLFFYGHKEAKQHDFIYQDKHGVHLGFSLIKCYVIITVIEVNQLFHVQAICVWWYS